MLNARFVKPLDQELILPLAEKIGRVVTLDEGCVPGGFGSAVAEALLDGNVVVPVKRIGVPDVLVEHAQPNESKVDLGLSNSQIADRILQALFKQKASAVMS